MSASQPHDPESDRRLSLDGHLEPAPTPDSSSASASASTSRRPPRDTPNSPRPRLFDNLPLPSGPVASDVLSEADYRRLRSSAFQPRALAGPLLVSSALAYLAPRFLPSRSGNTGTLRSGIFLFSLTSLLTISTFRSLSREVGAARQRAEDRVAPRTPDGQLILAAHPAEGQGKAEAAEEQRGARTLRDRDRGLGMDPELAQLGKERPRTRWVKGKGLEGEVEEEDELRDTFLRPGVPRNPE